MGTEELEMACCMIVKWAWTLYIIPRKINMNMVLAARLFVAVMDGY